MSYCTYVKYFIFALLQMCCTFDNYMYTTFDTDTKYDQMYILESADSQSTAV